MRRYKFLEPLYQPVKSGYNQVHYPAPDFLRQLFPDHEDR